MVWMVAVVGWAAGGVGGLISCYVDKFPLRADKKSDYPTKDGCGLCLTRYTQKENYTEKEIKEMRDQAKKDKGAGDNRPSNILECYVDETWVAGSGYVAGGEEETRPPWKLTTCRHLLKEQKVPANTDCCESDRCNLDFRRKYMEFEEPVRDYAKFRISPDDPRLLNPFVPKGSYKSLPMLCNIGGGEKMNKEYYDQTWVSPCLLCSRGILATSTSSAAARPMVVYSCVRTKDIHDAHVRANAVTNLANSGLQAVQFCVTRALAFPCNRPPENMFRLKEENKYYVFFPTCLVGDGGAFDVTHDFFSVSRDPVTGEPCKYCALEYYTEDENSRSPNASSIRVRGRCIADDGLQSEANCMGLRKDAGVRSRICCFDKNNCNVPIAVRANPAKTCFQSVPLMSRRTGQMFLAALTRRNYSPTTLIPCRSCIIPLRHEVAYECSHRSVDELWDLNEFHPRLMEACEEDDCNEPVLVCPLSPLHLTCPLIVAAVGAEYAAAGELLRGGAGGGLEGAAGEVDGAGRIGAGVTGVWRADPVEHGADVADLHDVPPDVLQGPRDEAGHGGGRLPPRPRPGRRGLRGARPGPHPRRQHHRLLHRPPLRRARPRLQPALRLHRRPHRLLLGLQRHHRLPRPPRRPPPLPDLLVRRPRARLRLQPRPQAPPRPVGGPLQVLPEGVLQPAPRHGLRSPPTLLASFPSSRCISRRARTRRGPRPNPAIRPPSRSLSKRSLPLSIRLLFRIIGRFAGPALCPAAGSDGSRLDAPHAPARPCPFLSRHPLELNLRTVSCRFI